MIDYYEIKSQPITRVMVWRAYHKVRANKGSAGVDQMGWKELERDLPRQLYKLWNRLSSGSYFPQPVKEVAIVKKGGGERKLGIPTILDRVAQEVVRAHLERVVEPLFHDSSFGYRPGRSCHQAVERLSQRVLCHDWAIDLDIRNFFDTIDHDLLLQAVKHYCPDRWVLLYLGRWLKAGIVQRDGTYLDRLTGTPQGGVISPLLANVFLHVAFDKWMEKHHPEKSFERYADDIVVHCKSEKQAQYVLAAIRRRLEACKLQLHPAKTRIVNLRGESAKKYPRSLDFLGFSLRPIWCRTSKGPRLLITTAMSKKSRSSVLGKFNRMRIHRWRKPLEQVASELRPVIQGVINYYCKFWPYHTHSVWHQLNCRLLKWAKWEKGMYKKEALRWFRARYKEKPNLFPHWKLVRP
ncbi:group II intron reverse transcriptase/maturase [Pontibacter sp. SGAir0037]|uniref:group II intron reverse transcriptase/maturase n=1 Tax=Pontibacter sp. SGAir0037 TaxID=2571030 RepID=UPI0010CCC8ED|nr:group II intron reverse transcriptase/maturase [Pontibacter sp. SGAir0037]QCR21913.1 group II intron reverse transcriptase/maturase [Pontibacter sp. SGAir0037]